MSDPRSDNPEVRPPGPASPEGRSGPAARLETKGTDPMATTEKDIANELDAVKEDMRQLRADMKELASLYRQAAQERMQRTSQRIGEGYRDKAHAVREHLQDYKLRAQDGAHKAEEWVEQRPFTTALAALGIGLVTGVMIGGHRR